MTSTSSARPVRPPTQRRSGQKIPPRDRQTSEVFLLLLQLRRSGRSGRSSAPRTSKASDLQHSIHFNSANPAMSGSRMEGDMKHRCGGRGCGANRHRRLHGLCRPGSRHSSGPRSAPALILLHGSALPRHRPSTPPPSRFSRGCRAGRIPTAPRSSPSTQRNTKSLKQMGMRSAQLFSWAL